MENQNDEIDLTQEIVEVAEDLMPTLHASAHILLAMGFSDAIVRRSVDVIDNPFDLERLVEQCLFFDQIGTIPSSLLLGKSLEEATFKGSIVTSTKYHMTYSVVEVDKQNACMFIIPSMFNSFNWGRHARKALWVCVNDPQIEWQVVKHESVLPCWYNEDRTWYSLPKLELDLVGIREECMNKDWKFLRKNVMDTGVQLLDDIIILSMSDTSTALVDRPKYLSPGSSDINQKFCASQMSHMKCICDIHNISRQEFQQFVNDDNVEAIVALGHGLAEIYAEYKDSYNVYNARYKAWKKRCLQFAKVSVVFDWDAKKAVVKMYIHEHVGLKTDMLGARDRRAVSHIFSKIFMPKLYKTVYVSNNEYNSICTNSAKKATNFKKNTEHMFIPKSITEKLLFNQRKTLQFLVKKGNSKSQFGWAKLGCDDEPIAYHFSGRIQIFRRRVFDQVNIELDKESPIGAITVQPPRSGKSTLAALFVYNQILKHYEENGSPSNGIVVVNKCSDLFIKNRFSLLLLIAFHCF